MLTQTHRTMCLAIFIGFIIADQLTKHWALFALNPGESFEILPVFSLTLTFNEGVGLSFFSFLSNVISEYSQLFFGSLSLIISIAIVLLFRKEQRLVSVIGWAMVLSGAMGNAIDRFLAFITWRTGVVDFLHFHWLGQYHFPIFNIADCGITLGFALVIIDMLFFSKPKSETLMEENKPCA